MYQELIRNELTEAAGVLQAFLADEQNLQNIEAAARLLADSFKQEGKVLSCGNGGSHCDAMHFAEELTGRYRNNRAGLPAQAISDVGHLTCVANDFGYDQVFARYVLRHGRRGDCLFASSTSGRSANVLTAAAAARERGMRIVALTGVATSELGALADVTIATPAGKFADRAQELHIKVIHILIELIERHFFPGNDEPAQPGGDPAVRAA